ncbi:MAG: TetR/AcrR family transcriptional regulator [Azospirillaceae bacterium]|nr:TetR/AcrR family transcriptional regulator [Azospirillaceae bacterium]
MPHAQLLAAADALFADSGSPGTVTMDAIAVAAGVGKGTLFRAFGSRDGLLDALWVVKLAALHDAVDHGAPPLGPGGAPRDRAVAFLDALLSFKMDNRHLIRARELAPRLLQSAHYLWMHGLLRSLIAEAAPGVAAADAIYTAHALLAAVHIDLIEELLAAGLSVQAIRDAQAARVRSVIDGAGRG